MNTETLRLTLFLLSYPFGILGLCYLFTPFIPFSHDGPKPLKFRVLGGVLFMIGLYLLSISLSYSRFSWLPGVPK